MLELVDGEQLDKFIAKNGGAIPPETERKLQKLFQEAAEINRRSAIKLDISADNIFIRADGEVVLVDFGPIRPEDIFAADYETARTRWLTAGAARLPATPTVPAPQSCGMRALNKLLSEP